MRKLTSTVVAALLVALALPAEAQDADRERAARAHFEEAQRAYTAGDFPRAAQEFSLAYDLHPSPEVAFNVARVSERAGDLDVAIRFYELYLRTATLPEADAATARATLERLRLERERRANQIQVRATSAEIAGEARTFFERGVRLFRRKNYRAALVAFEAAYSMARAANARVPELHYNMAVTLERLAGKTRDRCQRVELLHRAADTYENYRLDSQGLSARELETVRAQVRTLRAEQSCGGH